jgi:predicted Rossmann fold nucleotide-binding protein DprA/Smf involved in DNA uptake
MKEIEKILKTVSDGLKLAAQGMLSLAEKVNEAAKTMGTTEKSVAEQQAAAVGKLKTKTKTSKKGKTTVKVIRTKKNAGAQAMTAIDTIFDIVKKSDKPVGMATLREKTGFESKKIANVLFKLKKQGKIKSVGKGVYTSS